MARTDFTLAEAYSDRARRQRQESLDDEAARLSGSLSEFIRAAWPIVEPGVPYQHNWHIDAMSEILTAISDGEIHRAQIWVPPGSMKSTEVSIMWPAWEWTSNPWLRYFSGSYALALSQRLTRSTRDLILHPWYQARWGHLFRMRKTNEGYYSNDQGGTRLATAPGGTGSGEHGHRILIDDPVNARDLAKIGVGIEAANQWYDTTLSTRSADPKTHAELIIMQRLSGVDLAAHVLEFGEDWTILALPEEYDSKHPFVWPDDPRDPGNPKVEGIDQGDGALLWPDRVGPKEHEARARKMGPHQAAGQLQQQPSAREGAILKRAYWRYYDRAILEAAELGDVSGFPKFDRVFCTWDTSFKEKTSSDFVAGGVWGIKGGDHYLLRVVHAQMALGATKTAMKEMRSWVIERWGARQLYVVIEKSANGVEILEQLQREIAGCVPFSASTDKTSRAEAAEPAFASRNVLVCGLEAQTLGDYDKAQTPPWAQAVIEECAKFPTPGEHDDLVDMVTMAINWNRENPIGSARTTVPRREVNVPRTDSATTVGAPRRGTPSVVSTRVGKRRV